MQSHFDPIPGIDQSLQALKLHESRVRPEGATLIRTELGRSDGNTLTTAEALWLSTNGSIGVDTLVRVMSRSLKDLQHDSSELAASLVLAQYVACTAPADRNALGIAAFLGHIVDAAAEVTFVIPVLEGVTADFKLGSFRFERTDLRRLRDLCDRVGSNYAERYAEMLRDTQSLRSPVIPCRVINRDSVSSPTPFRYRLYDEYMAAVASGIRDSVVRAYTEETALLSIIHEWMFPLERIAQCAPLNAITLFRERAHPNSRGWVVPWQGAFKIEQSLDFWPMGARIAESWSGSAIGRLGARDDVPAWLMAPSKLLVSAMARCDGKEWDLAGLIATSAIELILCESSQDLQKSVSRLGECVCRYADTSGRQMGSERIKKLYDTRSKFVHEGRPIGEQDARDLVLLARTVTVVAARAASLSEQPRSFDRHAWLRKLEAVHVNDAAGIPMSTDVLRSSGLVE